MSSYIPFALPDYGEEEIAAVSEVIRSGWTTSGPRAAEFEKEFAYYVESSHALALNSGTAALHLALNALGVGPGDEVITTPLTFCATLNSIVHVGATPVLADIGKDLNLDPDAVESAITPRTRAILPVHLGGLPVDMDRIWKLAKARGLYVVEDAAHAAGSLYKGHKIGAGPSDAVAYSFYATKNLSTGEGGMVTTHSASLNDRMRVLALHGISRDAWGRYTEKGSWRYDVIECGFKYNMSDIAAALGIQQLRKLDAMNFRRIQIARRYNEALAGVGQIELPPDAPQNTHCWHIYAIRLNLERMTIDRARVIEELKALGIGCSVHFIPIPLLSYYRPMFPEDGVCPRAIGEYQRLVSLPIYSKMTDEQVDRVIRAVQQVSSLYARRA